jgi:hypothetical protein
VSGRRRRKQLTCDQTHSHQSWWWYSCPMPVERAELVRLWALRAYDLALVSENTVALVFKLSIHLEAEQYT